MYVSVYVCMYVCIYMCVYCDTLSMCSACSMCVCILQLDKDRQRRSHANSHQIKGHDSAVPELNSSTNSQQVKVLAAMERET